MEQDRFHTFTDAKGIKRYKVDGKIRCKSAFYKEKKQAEIRHDKLEEKLHTLTDDVLMTIDEDSPQSSNLETHSSFHHNAQLCLAPDVPVNNNEVHIVNPLLVSNERNSLASTFQSLMEKYSQRGSSKQRAKLMKWCIEHNVKRRAVDKLLKMTKTWTEETILDLPMCAKSLIPSFSHYFQKTILPPGEFYYLGIQENLRIPSSKFFNHENEVIELTINIDGVPAFQSGGKGFWPILASTPGHRVFLIAFYFGIAKPYDANKYLRPLVDEIKSFYINRKTGENECAYIDLSNGDKEKQYKFKLDKIVCDVPAKSYILSIKSHTGYFSCTRCKIEGELGENNHGVYFPDHFDENARETLEYYNVTWDDLAEGIQEKTTKWLKRNNAEDKDKSSDQSKNDDDNIDEEDVTSNNDRLNDFTFYDMDARFQLPDDDAYHCESEEETDEEGSPGQKIPVEQAVRVFHLRRTILTEIPNWELSLRIVIDYMHLLLAGLMKRLLAFWCSNKRKYFNNPNADMDLISERLQEIIEKYFPREFQRCPAATLESYKTWKCTQLRDFLLYYGAVVLHGCLKLVFYQQFVVLSACCRFLCKECSKEKARSNLSTITKIRATFRMLIEEFKKLYGQKFVTHNVHNLYHLPDDYLEFGSLDNFSSFPYESFLGELKEFPNSGFKPSEQVINRYFGKMFAEQYEDDEDSDNVYGLKGRYTIFETKEVKYKCYKVYQHKKFFIRTDKKEADQYCHWDEKEYACITKILEHTDTSQIYLEMHPYSKEEGFYPNDIPFPSKDVRIVKIKKSSVFPPVIRQLDINKFRKCFPMPFGNSNGLILAGYLHNIDG